MRRLQESCRYSWTDDFLMVVVVVVGVGGVGVWGGYTPWRFNRPWIGKEVTWKMFFFIHRSNSFWSSHWGENCHWAKQCFKNTNCHQYQNRGPGTNGGPKNSLTLSLLCPSLTAPWPGHHSYPAVPPAATTLHFLHLPHLCHVARALATETLVQILCSSLFRPPDLNVYLARCYCSAVFQGKL